MRTLVAAAALCATLGCAHADVRILASPGGQVGPFIDLFDKVPHMTFPGGKHLRSPLLALGMLWHRLKEVL